MRKFIQDRYFPFITFMLKSPHAFGFIEALVDTGSPTKLDPKQLEAIKHIPSIVGNDFLEQEKFGLYVNPSTKVAYLERTP
jgi:hypothetical protein